MTDRTEPQDAGTMQPIGDSGLRELMEQAERIEKATGERVAWYREGWTS